MHSVPDKCPFSNEARGWGWAGLGWWMTEGEAQDKREMPHCSAAKPETEVNHSVSGFFSKESAGHRLLKSK